MTVVGAIPVAGSATGVAIGSDVSGSGRVIWLWCDRFG